MADEANDNHQMESGRVSGQRGSPGDKNSWPDKQSTICRWERCQEWADLMNEMVDCVSGRSLGVSDRLIKDK